MIKITFEKVAAVIGLAMFAGLLLAPGTVPVTHGLTVASQTAIITGATNAVDDTTSAHFGTVLTYMVGFILLFGFVAVILSLIWRGIRTLMGRI